MTRLSDLLRSAADRAPLGDASVALGRTARRVRVQRGLRGVGNGVAGLGAVALITLGVVQPGAANNAALSGALAPEAAPDAGQSSLGAKDSSVASDGRWMAWGECGSFPLQDYGTGGSDDLAIAANFDGASTPEGGATLDIPVTVTVVGDRNLDLTTSGPDAVVLWGGMVVATLSASEAEQALSLATGDTVESVASLALVDCFAGEPLPASTYELVVSQAFLDASAIIDLPPEPKPSIDPTVAPVPEPLITPGDDPLPRTTLPVDPGAETGSDATDVTTIDVEPLPVEPQGWDYRITSEPIAFAVAGDPVDNPFANYYPQPWTPPALPDDILTPSAARALFEAAATSSPWDMAKGTSRWILPNEYSQRETVALMPVEQSYFGCSPDGVSGPTFPTRSADLDLLSISTEVPNRLSVSYGWVVDDNPEITLSVTNTSSYSIPGFYNQPNRSLYLVKDGRVVAEAYPMDIDPNGGGMLYKEQRALLTEAAALSTEAGGVAYDASQEDPSQYWGLLSPGASVSGTYLWRDVNGCWREDGSTTNLSAGTYTLLTQQSISLQQYDTGVSIGDGAPEPGPLVDDVTIDPANSTFAPVQGAWLDLQVWTSLGTVTITTH